MQNFESHGADVRPVAGDILPAEYADERGVIPIPRVIGRAKRSAKGRLETGRGPVAAGNRRQERTFASTNGNSVAQFCRNCHGGESNEAHGLMNVPTI